MVNTISTETVRELAAESVCAVAGTVAETAMKRDESLRQARRSVLGFERLATIGAPSSWFALSSTETASGEWKSVCSHMWLYLLHIFINAHYRQQSQWSWWRSCMAAATQSCSRSYYVRAIGWQRSCDDPCCFLKRRWSKGSQIHRQSAGISILWQTAACIEVRGEPGWRIRAVNV